MKTPGTVVSGGRGGGIPGYRGKGTGGPYGVLPYTVGTSPPGTCISLVPVDTLYSHCTTSRMYPTLGTGIYWYRGPRGMQYQGVTTSTVTVASPPYRPLPLPVPRTGVQSGVLAAARYQPTTG